MKMMLVPRFRLRPEAWLSEVFTRCKGPWEMECLEVWATASLLEIWLPDLDLTHPSEHLVPGTPTSHRMTEQVMKTCS